MKRYCRYISAAAALFTAFSLTACGTASTVEKNTAKTVSVQPVSVKSTSDGLDYIGFVKAKETKNYSFLMAGKIAEISVKKGDSFKAGDVLAKLDTTTLEFSAGVGSNTTTQAKAGLDKTISTYDTNIKSAETSLETLNTSIEAAETGIAAMENSLVAAQQNIDAGQLALDTLYSKLTSTRTLHENGLVTDKDMEALEAQYTSQEASLEAAKATYQGTEAELKGKKAELQSLYNQKKTVQDTIDNLKKSKEDDVKSVKSQISSAEISESITQKNINDAVIKAESDGYVMELPFKEGEVTSAGYPVVVAKSKNSIVSIGVPDTEYGSIYVGQKAIINDSIEGTVSLVSQYPDESTRTYRVEIDITDTNLAMGETVNVKLITGDKDGYYVPISSVFNLSGVDYVYIVKDGRVIRKQVILGETDGADVRVDIDDPEVSVVTEGIKSLRENDAVIVKSEGSANGQ